MARPTIITVDDDPQVSSAITRDLLTRYGEDYRVVRTGSGREALEVLASLALRDDPVALIVTDQRMPGMTGTEMLDVARDHAPDAKKLLLTAYADTEVAITAINEIGLDYYLLKPWDPPAERLYPVVDDLLGDWHREHPDHTSELRVVGHRWSERSHELKTFLARNHVPYRWHDVERDAEGARLRRTGRGRPGRPAAGAGRLAGGRCARRRRSTWPTPSASTPPPGSRSTTCASSAAGRPAWRPRSTPRRRGCAPSSSSARRPAGRPARVPRSRTTSASPAG